MGAAQLNGRLADPSSVPASPHIGSTGGSCSCEILLLVLHSGSVLGEREREAVIEIILKDSFFSLLGIGVCIFFLMWRSTINTGTKYTPSMRQCKELAAVYGLRSGWYLHQSGGWHR